MRIGGAFAGAAGAGICGTGGAVDGCRGLPHPGADRPGCAPPATGPRCPGAARAGALRAGSQWHPPVSPVTTSPRPSARRASLPSTVRFRCPVGRNGVTLIQLRDRPNNADAEENSTALPNPSRARRHSRSPRPSAPSCLGRTGRPHPQSGDTVQRCAHAGVETTRARSVRRHSRSAAGRPAAGAGGRLRRSRRARSNVRSARGRTPGKAASSLSTSRLPSALTYQAASWTSPACAA